MLDLKKLNKETTSVDDPNKKISKLQYEIELLRKTHNIPEKGSTMRTEKEENALNEELKELKEENAMLNKKVNLLSMKLNELKPGMTNDLLSSVVGIFFLNE